ncbi:MAG: hypothetical protein AAB110_10250 [Candidatus Desantisbacteria bacterium]
MSNFRDIVSSIMTLEGAVIEQIEPQGIEVIAPESLQKALSIPEWSRIGFGPELPDQAMRVTIESDWTEKIGNLLGDRGRLLSISLEENSLPKLPSNPEQLIKHELNMENATYRLKDIQEEKTRYLLLTFQITAISDEKREDILSLCLNESNGSIVDNLCDPILAHISSLKNGDVQELEDDVSPAPWDVQRVKEVVKKVIPGRIRTRLSPFLAGMERRMKRDIDRLYDYHTELRREAARRLAEKKQKGKEEDELEKEHNRLASIAREYQTKIADLQRKYAMTVEIDLVQSLRLIMPVYRFNLLIMRRKGSRNIHLDWNPISKRLESLFCQRCLSSLTPYWICDDHLHLLCPSCISACTSCNKEYCRVCYPTKCPKCGHSS